MQDAGFSQGIVVKIVPFSCSQGGEKIAKWPSKEERFDGEISSNEKLTITQSNKIRSEMPSEAPIKWCRVVIKFFLFGGKASDFCRPSQVKHILSVLELSMLKTTDKSSSFDFVFVKTEDCTTFIELLFRQSLEEFRTKTERI